ncbi:MAG TPA: class II aldolase/adducin family protein [Exilispira sp.]|nr:class II aldolase/adducin family protein [Exilispira sp.]
MINLSDDLQEIINQKKKELIEICKAIVEKGLVAGTWGNVSTKIDDNFIIITPSGINYDKLSFENIPIVNIKTKEFIGEKPSTELNLHLKIYEKKNDIKAIIHTHSIYASLFAVTGKSLPPILEEIAQICGPKIKCAKYAIAGSDELVKNTIEVLQESNAAFLANHGAIACGRTLKEALTCALILEKGCKIFYKSKNIGKIRILPEKEAIKLYNFYREKYQSKPE